TTAVAGGSRAPIRPARAASSGSGTARNATSAAGRRSGSSRPGTSSQRCPAALKAPASERPRRPRPATRRSVRFPWLELGGGLGRAGGRGGGLLGEERVELLGVDRLHGLELLGDQLQLGAPLGQDPLGRLVAVADQPADLLVDQ